MVPYSREKLSIHFSRKERNFGDLSNEVDVIIKDSWPLVSQATQELDILEKNEGKWGVAQIYTGYQVVPYKFRPVCAPAGARLGMDCTMEDLQRDAAEEAEDIMLAAPPSGDSSSMAASGFSTVVMKSAIPLARTNVRIVFKTDRVPLTTVIDPKIQVKALLDAVIW